MAANSATSGIDYQKFKGGKLKLKGVKLPSASGSKRKQKPAGDEAVNEFDLETNEHGGWWRIREADELRAGCFAIEVAPHTYMSAMDNGRFTIGAPHTPGEGPSPEEILTILKPADAQWIGLKSGYGKYLGVDSHGLILAVVEAVGGRERWDVVFEEGRTALQASNASFLSTDQNSDGYLYATSRSAKAAEMITIRTNMERAKPVDLTPGEDKLQSGECELAYVKKFQSFEDRKLRLNPGDVGAVKRARVEGDLHETLLDRREKMKSDKFCK